MVEARVVAPLRERVTTFALCSDLSFMLVLVTRQALGLQPQVGAVQVANSNALPLLWCDVLSRVAFFALQPRVGAHQRVSRLAVIEFLQADFPQNRNELAAVVFRMALDASVIAALPAHQDRMQSPFLVEPDSDFSVACRTAELAGAATADVTACAMRRTIELVVGLRQGSR